MIPALAQDLGRRDLDRGKWQRQQMVHRAVLTLADHGGPAQQDGQHSDIVDDADDAHEPSRRGIGIECQVIVSVTGIGGATSGAGQCAGHLGQDDLLHVADADARLHRGGGIDVDLHRRVPPGLHVALEMRRNVDDEGVSRRGPVAGRYLRPQSARPA